MTVDKTQLKALVKEAIWELFEEKREAFSDLFVDILEDLALSRAISEGEISEPSSREEVFAILDTVP